MKECKVNLRPKQPWIDGEVKQLKKKVHKYEKKWLKYKYKSLWCAYKKVRNSYFGKLDTKKKNILKAKIEECANDSHKLHSLVTNLTTKNMEVEWPDLVSDDQLAEDFASYFQGKMEKITKSLRISPRTQHQSQMYQS